MEYKNTIIFNRKKHNFKIKYKKLLSKQSAECRPTYKVSFWGLSYNYRSNGFHVFSINLLLFNSHEKISLKQPNNFIYLLLRIYSILFIL